MVITSHETFVEIPDPVHAEGELLTSVFPFEISLCEKFMLIVPASEVLFVFLFDLSHELFL